VFALKKKIPRLYIPHAIFLLLFIPLLVLNVYYVPQPFVQPVSISEQVMGAKTSRTEMIKDIQPEVAKATSKPSPTSNLQPHYIYLGMWTEGFWDDSSQSVQPQRLIELQNKIGKKPAIAHFFTGWSNLTSDGLIAQLRVIKDNGWRPMISVNPYFFEKCQSDGKTLYQAIADGACDEFLTEATRKMKSFGQPLFLRFAWEMNIESMEWSIQRTGSSPGEFIQAWRRFHDIASKEGATNILWVFCPNVASLNALSFSSIYPGNSYVNWTGLDGYNWGSTQSWSSWQSFGTIFSASYKSLVKLAPSKPIMLGETNTTNVGGDKAAWYQDMLVNELPNQFPQIKAVVFYNENRTDKEGVNWLIDITPESLSTFAKSINSPIYLSSF
jgi:beta-mannanase